MNNTELLIVLVLGTALMCFLIALQMNRRQIALWKSIVVSLMLVLTGVVGSRVWYFVENGTFLGRSFFGAVFIAPIVFLPVAKILKIAYSQMMDFVPPAGCLTLAMVKIQCLRDGCCNGYILYLDENYNYVRFPSQLVEMVVFLLIGGTLLVLDLKKNFKGKLFLLFLVMYGASRFILDFFRDIEGTYALGLSAGSFWSLVAFIAGSAGLLFFYRKDKICSI